MLLLKKSGAGDGNRTHATSLEGWDSTIELHPHRLMLVHSIKVSENCQMISGIIWKIFCYFFLAHRYRFKQCCRGKFSNFAYKISRLFCDFC